MKIKYDYPPNYEKICEVLNIRGMESVIFTYGDTVYIPSGESLPHHIEVHEATHIKQQKEIGADVWWDKYLVDTNFRLEQELEAYRNQWKAARKIRDWRHIQQILNAISNDLSGEMYGKIVTKAEAQKLITQ